MAHDLLSKKPANKRGDAVVGLLKVLADENRLKILSCLAKKAMCVCQLTECLGIPQNLMSHHLKVLRDAGLINAKRRSRWIYYSMKAMGINELLGQIENLCDCATVDSKSSCLIQGQSRT